MSQASSSRGGDARSPRATSEPLLLRSRGGARNNRALALIVDGAQRCRALGSAIGLDSGWRTTADRSAVGKTRLSRRWERDNRALAPIGHWAQRRRAHWLSSARHACPLLVCGSRASSWIRWSRSPRGLAFSRMVLQRRLAAGAPPPDLVRGTAINEPYLHGSEGWLNS